MIEAYNKVYTPPTIDNTFSFNTFLLKCMPYIYYPVQFKKDQANIQALLDFVSKIHIINPVYIARLRLKA